MSITNILTAIRYLQDLQKQVEQHQRSPSNTILEGRHSIETPFTYRSPPSATISSAPPPYRSSIEVASVHSQPSYCSPSISQGHSQSFSPGLKRNSDAAFGECGVDTSLASPALTVEGSHSHQQSESDPANKGPPSSSVSAPYQQGESPLSIWPSAFTIPSKIIKNTRKNRRTWSES